jgi:hypothetical protein
MFMFADAILFMSKSHRRHDAVDQKERARHLRQHLPLQSIHHHFVLRRGQPFTFTFHVMEGLHELQCCAFTITSPMWIHWGIALVFRVMEDTLQNRRISSHGSSSHHQGVSGSQRNTVSRYFQSFDPHALVGVWSQHLSDIIVRDQGIPHAGAFYFKISPSAEVASGVKSFYPRLEFSWSHELET